MLKKTKIIQLLLLYCLGLVVAVTTSPNSVPVFALLLPFIYIFVVLYLSAMLALELMQFKKPKIVSILIASLGTMMFILGSLRQLGLRDILLSITLTVLLTWYVQKMRPV